MALFERLSQELRKKSITLSGLEKQLGFGNGTIKRWDKSSPSVDKVLEVANYLNISVEYLITGKIPNIIESDPNYNYLQFESTSQKIDYVNRVLHIKDDTIFIRFKEARAAAGTSLEEAAKGSFLKEEELLLLEDDDIPTNEIEGRMEKLQEIGLEQYAYLAFRYNVDLFWLLCGKVRPPAAVVQSGKLVFPPYEFMMEGYERPTTVAPEPMPDYSHLSLSPGEEELLHAYSYLTKEGKDWIYDLILDYLKKRQKISYSRYKEDQHGRDGIA